MYEWICGAKFTQMPVYQYLISVAELESLRSAQDCRIVDCRFDLMDVNKGRKDYLSGHIPGAVFADLDQDLAGPVTPESGRHPLPDARQLAERIADWGINNDSQVVAYDGGNGALAAHFWWLLRWLGHDRVAVLDGGLKAWVDAGLALDANEPDFQRGAFRGHPDPGKVVSTDELASAITQRSIFNLVDARDRSRYLGESEPIDAIAGHIPGALNLPLSRNLNDQGFWQPPETLRELWRETLVDRPAAPVTVMCGSGVTACHLALSACLAGKPEPRLYVGSWSEWIRDPRRPAAAGNEGGA